jgi:Xaa-Pro aminopeptidase
MALHFSQNEYAERMVRLQEAMAERDLGCLMLFSQESMYWLTGYDTFGFCFFQCLVVTRNGEMALLTRAPDLRQARHTSIIDNIVVWTDRGGADPTNDLHALMGELDLVGEQIGVEYRTPGLTGYYERLLESRFRGFGEFQDASDLVPGLRAVKSRAELTHVRKAAKLADAALDAALSEISAGADEGKILAAMHSGIFAAGGDYPANEFVIGSGKDALLCRYKSGRRKLSKNDQLTLEWAGVWAHYHAAMMRTIIVGKPTARHQELYEAASEALVQCRDAAKVGRPVSDIFDAHSKVLDAAGLTRHRFNQSGYSLGATFAPSWMDPPMIYADNRQPIEANMVLFLHVIVADSDSGTAMMLGQSYVTGAGGARDLSEHEIDLIVR